MRRDVEGIRTASVAVQTPMVNRKTCPQSFPPLEYRLLDFDSIEAPTLTHYLFRFPAKFHPPVVHSLIRSYTEEGQTLLDPFCGSGTLLLAAAYEGRNAKGSDVDPLAVFVSGVKAHRFQPRRLRASWERLRPLLDAIERPPEEYADRMFEDISPDEYWAALENESLWTPAIPNLLHWFRRYVVVDLARILNLIGSTAMPETHRTFFQLMFASVIRKTSNADPVPVSGLEVTSHMRRLDATGRLIDPIDIFARAIEKGLCAVEEYWEVCKSSSQISVIHSDARALSTKIRKPVDAVITSPPYHNAVDYYRRHQLEMFWLGLTADRTNRLDLLGKYVGRHSVKRKDPILNRSGELVDQHH